jgi:hypothetical protein
MDLSDRWDSSGRTARDDYLTCYPAAAAFLIVARILNGAQRSAILCMDGLGKVLGKVLRTQQHRSLFGRNEAPATPHRFREPPPMSFVIASHFGCGRVFDSNEKIGPSPHIVGYRVNLRRIGSGSSR